MTSKPLSLFYCDQYPFPLPDGHKFPLSKYRLLREALTGDPQFQLQPARLAEDWEVKFAHDAEYVDAFLSGAIDPLKMRRIGFPWSQELVTRTLASVGSTLCATEAALQRGFGGTLAGGTHHAYRGEGSGFCVFNDLAVSIAWARREHGVERFAIVDLDVHQGDGTASIFSGDPQVFTLSLHGEKNFPFRKQVSALDVPLKDGTNDDEYMQALAGALVEVERFRPELVFYQSGVDGLITDRLGRLSLTLEGLRRRDEAVAALVKRMGLPLTVTIGGGYSDPIEETVKANAQTFRVMASSLP